MVSEATEVEESEMRKSKVRQEGPRNNTLVLSTFKVEKRRKNQQEKL
jgi:hypothetical protein